MSLVIPLLALIVLPAVTAVFLLGPFRDASRERLVWFAGVLVAVSLCLVGAAALLLQGDPGRAALAVGALALGPLAGTFTALRIEAVRSDRRLAFIFGPLGYLAGVAVAVRILVALGFAP